MPSLNKPLVVPQFGAYNTATYEGSPPYSAGLPPHTINLFGAGGAAPSLLASIDLDQIFTGLGINPATYLPSPNVCLPVGVDLYVAISGLPVDGDSPAAAILKFAGYFAGANTTATASATIFTQIANTFVGLAWDGAGLLYSAENENSIFAYPIAASGATRTQLYQGDSEYFGDLVFDAAGNLWTADYNNNSVVVFLKPVPGSPVTRVVLTGAAGPFPVVNGAGGTVANLFSSPEGLAFDGAGNLWVGNNNDGYDGAGQPANAATTLVELTAPLLAQIVAAGTSASLAPSQALASSALVNVAAPPSGFAVYQVPNPDPPYKPQFGGMQIDPLSPAELAEGAPQYLYVNDEVYQTVWQLDVNPYSPGFVTTEPSYAAAALTLNDASGNPVVTNPGNGGIALVRADLLMEDTPSDTGAEPDEAALADVFWDSPDIGLGIASTPPAPPFTAYESITLDKNVPTYYVYANVRNRGVTPTTGSEYLRLYWASGATTQSWPGSWTEITTAPGVQVSAAPLAPGDSVALAVPWASSAIPHSLANSHYCLLARIETSPVAPFGMTYREDATTPDNMRGNVSDNAKIAQCNMQIVDPGGKKHPPFPIRFPIATGTGGRRPTVVNLKFQLLDGAARPVEFTHARLSLHAAPAVRSRLRGLENCAAGRHESEGLHIHDPARGLKIPVEAGEMLAFHVAFEPPHDLKEGFVLRAIQTDERGGKTEVVGGQTLVVGRVRGYTVRG